MTRYERFIEFSGRVEDLMMDSFFGFITVFLGVCILLFGIIFGIYWIFADKTDYGQCLESHIESYTTYVLVNKTTVPVTNYRNVCDMWEYPEGVAK